jgi:DNA-binding MarR family transcriptional regulator
MRADLVEAATEVRRGTLRLARRLRAERARGSLSSAKVTVLAHLYRHGPSTPGAIASAEHQQPQSLTRVFAELEQTGLVARTPSGRDRRASILSLTPEGQAVLAADMAQRDVWLTAALAELTEPELALLRIAGTLLERLADAAPVTQTVADAA